MYLCFSSVFMFLHTPRSPFCVLSFMTFLFLAPSFPETRVFILFPSTNPSGNSYHENKICPWQNSLFENLEKQKPISTLNINTRLQNIFQAYERDEHKTIVLKEKNEIVIWSLEEMGYSASKQKEHRKRLTDPNYI